MVATDLDAGGRTPSCSFPFGFTSNYFWDVLSQESSEHPPPPEILNAIPHPTSS